MHSEPNGRQRVQVRECRPLISPQTCMQTTHTHTGTIVAARERQRERSERHCLCGGRFGSAQAFDWFVAKFANAHGSCADGFASLQQSGCQSLCCLSVCVSFSYERLARTTMATRRRKLCAGRSSARGSHLSDSEAEPSGAPEASKLSDTRTRSKQCCELSRTELIRVAQNREHKFLASERANCFVAPTCCSLFVELLAKSACAHTHTN